MSAVIAYDSACETWNDVERLVYFAVWKFYRTYHWGDLEELFSIARLEFVTARPEYDPERNNAFGAYIYYKVWKRLLETMRESLRTGRRYRDAVDVEDVDIPMTESLGPFNLDEWISTRKRKLSKSARTLLQLTFETPADVVLAINQRTRNQSAGVRDNTKREIVIDIRQKGKASPRYVQAAIREYLTDLGWSRARITKTFSEIRKALT